MPRKMETARAVVHEKVTVTDPVQGEVSVDVGTYEASPFGMAPAGGEYSVRSWQFDNLETKTSVFVADVEEVERLIEQGQLEFVR